MNTHDDKRGGETSKAAAHKPRKSQPAVGFRGQNGQAPVQRTVYTGMGAMWAAVAPHLNHQDILTIINKDNALQSAYQDVYTNLSHMDFVYQKDAQPEAAIDPNLNGEYQITYGFQAEQAKDDLRDIDSRFVGSILHEMMHVATALQYNTNVPSGNASIGHMANMNLPQGNAQPGNGPWGVDQNQQQNMQAQLNILDANWEDLRREVLLDLQNGDLTQAQGEMIAGKGGRIAYAQGFLNAPTHYDTTLFDIVYYLVSEDVQTSRSYEYANRMLAEANVRRRGGMGVATRINRRALPQNNNNNQGGGCFITTACTERMGLPDDCAELTLLRDFRDNYLLNLPEGKTLLRLYYENSPAILSAIRRRKDEDEIFRELYEVIRECAGAVRDGNNTFAFETYCRMMLQLKKDFLPEPAKTDN